MSKPNASNSIMLVTAVGLMLILGGQFLIAASNKPPSKYVNLGDVPTHWRLVLAHSGDRLRKPGKERLTMSGTVTRNGASKGVPFQLIHELPNLIHYSEGQAGASNSLAFDGDQYGNPGGKSQSTDGDLVETVLYDSPTWFLYAPTSGFPSRRIGGHFRVNPKAGVAYTGPIYDVYTVIVPVQQPGKVKTQTKIYHVNEVSHLVEVVRYQQADAPSVNVQVNLSNWTTVSGNAVPQTIQRLENGIEVLRFNVSAALLGPSVSDGSFNTH